MRRDAHFWIVMLMRGLLALVVGSMIVVIPDMARTLLLLPLALVISLLGLATYGVLDSVLILSSRFMAESRTTRSVLVAQGMLGILIGALLLFVVFDRAKLEWFLSFAALQAICAGIGEVVIGRHGGTRATSYWNYAAATVALLTGAAYIVLRVGFAEVLSSNQVSWLVYAYLVAFGIAQCMTAARMLYADRSVLLGPEKANVR